MEAKKRVIKPGWEYDHLFPPAIVGTVTIKRNAALEDTVAFIPQVVASTLDQTKGIARKLKGKDTYSTCRKIWQFVYYHIKYQKDKDGYEQIRSPARAWRDRQAGVDCDCYSTFISSILTNLSIRHKLRITKYSSNRFQHIYPIIPMGSKEIILDCVTEYFDYEVPFSEKKDINMDLEYLNGPDDDYVFSGNDLDDLGDAPKKKKKKGFFKKILSKINKINPATIILRNGFLAAMKLNLFKVPSRIKYAYLSPEEASKRGIIPDKYQKLVKVKDKLESIFETAGGNPKNLKKAILKGKGNKNKEVAVSGLGFVDADSSVLYMNEHTPLAQLLGPEIYHSENIDGMEDFQGFGELGEPITGAAIAAASGAVAAIAKIIKSIGNIFGGKEKGSEDFSEDAAAAADKEIANTPAANNAAPIPGIDNTTTADSSPAASSNESSRVDSSSSDVDSSSSSTAVSQTLPTAVAASAATDAPPSTTNEGFWAKNKKWLLPTVIVGGAIAVIGIGMQMMHPNPKRATLHGLAGPPRKRRHSGKRKKNTKKQPVALL